MMIQTVLEYAYEKEILAVYFSGSDDSDILSDECRVWVGGSSRDADRQHNGNE